MAVDGSLQRLPSRGLPTFGLLFPRSGHVLEDAWSVCHHLTLTSQVEIDWVTGVHHGSLLLFLGAAATRRFLLGRDDLLTSNQFLEFWEENCRRALLTEGLLDG